MNRMFSAIAVLAMTLIAIVLSVKQTLAVREALGENRATALLAIEVVAGLALLSAVVLLLRKRFPLVGRSMMTTSVGAARPLRRLLSAVWS